VLSTRRNVFFSLFVRVEEEKAGKFEIFFVRARG
jgi:hypothetical protein